MGMFPLQPVQGVPYDAVVYLITTHATASSSEQAAHLGRRRDRVKEWRRKLYAAGLLDPRDRLPRRALRDEELERMTAILRSGGTLREAAEALERNYHTVRRHLEMRGLWVEDLAADARRPLCGVEIARELGVRPKLVADWIHAGALPAGRVGRQVARTTRQVAWRNGKRAPLGDRRAHLVQWPDLYAFLGRREYWMSWEPQRIVNADLRRAAEAHRRAYPGRWWSWPEVADALHYSRTSVRDWLRDSPPGAPYAIARWGATCYLWVPGGTALPEKPEGLYIGRLAEKRARRAARQQQAERRAA